MTDDQLRQLLQAALPPIGYGARTLPRATRSEMELWAGIERRLETRPRWSSFDTGLLAVVAMALLLFPELMFLVALHL